MDRRCAADKTAAVRHLRRWASLASAIGAVCLTVALPVTRADAQSDGNGLEEASVNSFDFDPGRGVVRVTIDLDLRNVTTDQVDGDVIRRSYFDTYSIPVPVGAENIVATRDGAVLDGTLVSDPRFPAFSTYRAALGTPLFSGESAALQVTYDHLGAPPRDPVPWRINEAYAGFVAFGIGDDGLVTLRIAQPTGYDFDAFTDLSGFDVGDPDQFGTVTYTRSGLDEDVRITVGMANDDRLVSQQLDVDGLDLELRSWPDDPEWADFAATTVQVGIPALEELIGSDWPLDDTLDVRQTVEPTLSGYAGWFDAQSSEIALGEALDADTIYHELSHAWFNSRLSPERWFTEGLAQVYAAELVRRDGEAPEEPSQPVIDDLDAGPLTDWAGIGGDRAVEEYGYATSFWVVDALVDQIGFDRAGTVIDALRTGRSAYDADQPGERPDEDWKRVYDAVVELGGATTARDLFAAYVVDPQDAALVERRDAASAGVAALEQRSAPWALPVGVRNRLERWQIDDAVQATVAADAVLALRAEVESIEATVGVDEPDRADAPYADAPVAARGGVDFSEATALLDDSIVVGRRLLETRRELDELAAAAGVSPPEVASLEGVVDFATGLDAAENQLAAVERTIEVDEQLDDASGLLVGIGRWGSDIDGDIDRARSQIEQGNSEAALSTLDSAADRIDDLGTLGALRLAVVAAIVLTLLAVLALYVRRRRRSARRDDRAADQPVIG